MAAPPGKTCPACGKAVDPLRAGPVAIVGGTFHHFCNSACKSRFYEARVASEAATADPPPVTLAAPLTILPAPVAVFEAKGSLEKTAPAPAVAPAEPLEAVVPFAVPRYDTRVLAPLSREVAAEEPPPETRRSPEEDDLPEPADTEDPEEYRGFPADEHEQDDVDGGVVAPASVPLRPTALPARRRAVPVAAVPPGYRLPAVAALAAFLAFFLPFLGLSVASLTLGAVGFGTVLLLVLLVTDREAPRAPLRALSRVPLLVALAGAIIQTLRGDGRSAATVTLAAAILFAVAVGDLVAALVPDPRNRVRALRDRLEAVGAGVFRGDIVRVSAGDTIAADGHVVDGEGAVHLFPEARRVVAVGPFGDERTVVTTLAAGAECTEGAFDLAVDALTTDAQLLHAAEDEAAPELSPRFAALVDRAPYAAPLAALVAAFAAFAGRTDEWDTILAACAGATAFLPYPLVVLSERALADARLRGVLRGVFYTDGDAFDLAARVDAAVLCARGAVLEGAPILCALLTDGSVTEEELIALAAGAERDSKHPMADAIRSAAQDRDVLPAPLLRCEEFPGLGVEARASGETVLVGNRALLLRHGVALGRLEAAATDLESVGKLALFVARAGRLIGLLGFEDRLAPEAHRTIALLHDASIEPILLSGESRASCEAMATQIGIDHVRAEVLPGDRAAEVARLAEAGHILAAVGSPRWDEATLGAPHVAVLLGPGLARRRDDEVNSEYAKDSNRVRRLGEPSTGAAPTILVHDGDGANAAWALAHAKSFDGRFRRALFAVAVPGGAALLGLSFGLAPGALAGLAAAIAAIAVPLVLRDPATPSGLPTTDALPKR